MPAVGVPTRHIVISESLAGITLPDPASGSSDHHLEYIDDPGVIPGTAVLFLRVQHSGSFALTVRVNQHHVLQGHQLVGISPAFFRFCIPNLKADNNVIVLSGTGTHSVTIRDVFIMYGARSVPLQPLGAE